MGDGQHTLTEGGQLFDPKAWPGGKAVGQYSQMLWVFGVFGGREARNQDFLSKVSQFLNVGKRALCLCEELHLRAPAWKRGPEWRGAAVLTRYEGGLALEGGTEQAEEGPLRRLRMGRGGRRDVGQEGDGDGSGGRPGPAAHSKLQPVCPTPGLGSRWTWQHPHGDFTVLSQPQGHKELWWPVCGPLCHG